MATTYFTALGLTETATPAEVKAAYATLASNGDHPDKGGDPKRWSLITAAYNEIKRMQAKKRGHTFGTNSDLAWLREWNDLNKPAAAPEPPKQEAPKAKRSKVNDGWVFEDIEGESKQDRSRRYARQRQQYRYQHDPKFAAARKASSSKSHKKSRDAAKAAREQADPGAADQATGDFEAQNDMANEHADASA